MTGSILVIGENVADAVVSAAGSDAGALDMKVFPGGGPANTAVALGRLGVPTSFAARLPKGVLGDLFTRRLREARVDISNSPSGEEPATLAIASLNNEGEAEYSFYATGTVDWQWRPDELVSLSSTQPACVHTGSLALAIEPGASGISKFLNAIRSQATISIDPNVRTALVAHALYRRKMADWCAVADIIRLSDADLREIEPEARPEDIFDEWHARGVSLVVVTQGSKNTLASLRGTRIDVPTVPVENPDTIGAGDAFTAGLLHWLHAADALGGRLENVDVESMHHALSYATLVAGLTCRMTGANPPWAEALPRDVRDLLPSD